MHRRLRLIPYLAAAALAAAAVMVVGTASAGQISGAVDPQDGHQHDTINAYCSAPTGHVCYFEILRARGGVIQIKVPGQQRLQGQDLEVGKDYYVVKIDSPPPLSVTICRTEATVAVPCHWGILKVAINDAASR